MMCQRKCGLLSPLPGLNCQTTLKSNSDWKANKNVISDTWMQWKIFMELAVPPMLLVNKTQPSSCSRGKLSDRSYLHLEFNDNALSYTKHNLIETTHDICSQNVSVVVALDVSFRFNPVPIMSHFGIKSRFVLFPTVYSPAYYSNEIPDVSVLCNNQRSSRVTLEKEKKHDQCEK